MRRVALIGAGYISHIHAEALRGIRGTTIAAVVDPNTEAARGLGARYGAPRVHATTAEALAEGGIDAAHVLVPPGLHAEVSRPLLDAGIPLLVEKPLAATAAECESLIAAAEASGAMLGVGQNFVFHPAFVKLRALAEGGRYGRPNFVDCVYNVPLAQLSVRQFGHWMFHAPGNILLEQAVHPLSQICALAGDVRELRAIADPAIEIAPGLPFFPATTVTLACARLPAQLRYAVGQSFPFWRISVVCDDGVIVADILANSVVAHGRTRYLETADNALSATRSAAAMAWAGWRNLGHYGAAMLRLTGRSDPFFRSMKASIAAFHAALDGGPRFQTDGRFGAMLVAACERIRDQAFTTLPAPAPAPAPAAPPTGEPVAVLGGTGFIGAETVKRLVAAGHPVRVMARSVRNLQPVFADPAVTVLRGDIRSEADVRAAIGPARIVVNLAHGGGGADFEAVRRAMVGGAETVARACLGLGVKRLVHVGSIASLYLGPDAGVVRDDAPSDPRAAERADYTRAKAIADDMLIAMHRQQGLPVVILRPGLVVGAGSAPLHAGLGFFNNEQHVIGWNAGRNPLPFVLVGDVAQAIVQACHADARVEGRFYNLVGDVRPSARDYVADLARAMGRPLRFHPQSATGLWLEDLVKWVIKRAGGRKAPLPSKRDLVSRGLGAGFDCSAAKRDLGWQPVADPAEFHRQAIAVHAR